MESDNVEYNENESHKRIMERLDKIADRNFDSAYSRIGMSNCNLKKVGRDAAADIDMKHYALKKYRK